MIKYLYLIGVSIAFCAILTSCNNKPNRDPLKNFKTEETLTVSRIINLDDYGVLNPVDAVKYKKGYVIRDMVETGILKYVKNNNNNNKTVISGVSKGNGPGEMTIATDLQVNDDKVILSDPNKNTIYSAEITNDSISLKKYHKSKIHFISFKMFENKKFITVFGNDPSKIKYGYNSWCLFVDNNDSVLSSIKYPKYFNKYSSVSKQMLFANTYFTIKPDHKKLAVINLHQSLISFANINSSKLRDYKSVMYYPPEITIEANNTVAYKKEGKYAFLSVVSDDSYVYVLYSDKTFLKDRFDASYCPHILVYNWNGNPVKKYKLRKHLSTLGIDRDRGILYGIGRNYTLVEYESPRK